MTAAAVDAHLAASPVSTRPCRVARAGRVHNDLAGNLTSVSDLAVSYGHDKLNRLVQRKQESSSAATTRRPSAEARWVRYIGDAACQ